MSNIKGTPPFIPFHRQETNMRNGKNERDAKRVGVWLAVLLGALVVGAVVFNLYWYERPPANVDNKPAVNAPAPAPGKPPGS